MNKPATARGIVFDLDGTLIDTAADLATAVNRTRADWSLPPLGIDEITGYVGNGAGLLIRRALDGSGITVADALPRFLEHYAASQLEQVRPYPGVLPLLERLQAKEVYLAVATNKPEPAARAILAHLGLERFFTHILGDNGGRPLKPDPSMMTTILTDWTLPAAACLHVGDSQVDVDFARAAGLRVIFIAGGMGRLGNGPAPDLSVSAFADLGFLPAFPD